MLCAVLMVYLIVLIHVITLTGMIGLLKSLLPPMRILTFIPLHIQAVS